MTINYHQEILTLLKNKIRIIPSIELISSNEEIALAVLKNFDEGRDYYSSYNAELWFLHGNWGEVLAAYKDNTDFWDKAVEYKKINKEVLLLKDFKKAFPFIHAHFFKNTEQITKLFRKTYAQEFLDLISDNAPEKIILRKEFLLYGNEYISSEKLQTYEDDNELIKGLLLKSSENYRKLSMVAQENSIYINILIQNEKDFDRIIPSKKAEFFEQWYELHKTKLISFNKITEIDCLKQDMKQKIFLDWYEVHKTNITNPIELLFLNDLDKDIQKKVYEDWYHIHKKDLILYDVETAGFAPILEEILIKDNPELVLKLAGNNLNRHTNAIFKEIKKDLHYVEKLSTEKFDLIKNDDKKLESLEPELNDFIENFKNLKELSIYEAKIISCIQRIPKLNILWNNNSFNLMNKSGKMSLEKLDHYFELALQKYDNNEISLEEMENYLNKLKAKLPVDILKELRIPKKGIYDFFKLRKLNYTLQDELPTGITKNRSKI